MFEPDDKCTSFSNKFKCMNARKCKQKIIKLPWDENFENKNTDPIITFQFMYFYLKKYY